MNKKNKLNIDTIKIEALIDVITNLSGSILLIKIIMEILVITKKVINKIIQDEYL
jgi:hypothetical protein